MIYWLNLKYHINCSGKFVAVWLHYAQIWIVWCRQNLLAFRIPCSKCMASYKTQECYKPIHFHVIFHLNDESLILYLLSIHQRILHSMDKSWMICLLFSNQYQIYPSYHLPLHLLHQSQSKILTCFPNKFVRLSFSI